MRLAARKRPRAAAELGMCVALTRHSICDAGPVAAGRKAETVFRRTKAVVARHGSSAIKAVELKAAGKTFKVAAYGSEPLPPDSIVDGDIIDSTAVAMRSAVSSRAAKRSRAKRSVRRCRATGDRQ